MLRYSQRGWQKPRSISFLADRGIDSLLVGARGQFMQHILNFHLPF